MAYGWPVKATLSARNSSCASGLSRRCRTALTACARTSSTSAESSVGRITRSANTAHEESNVAAVLRRANVVQSWSASTPMIEPSRAMTARSVSRGYLAVPRSLAASRSGSSPARLAGACRVPPSR
jgi:hypothetical protein